MWGFGIFKSLAEREAEAKEKAKKMFPLVRPQAVCDDIHTQNARARRHCAMVAKRHPFLEKLSDEAKASGKNVEVSPIEISVKLNQRNDAIVQDDKRVTGAEMLRYLVETVYHNEDVEVSDRLIQMIGVEIITGKFDEKDQYITEPYGHELCVVFDVSENDVHVYTFDPNGRSTESEAISDFIFAELEKRRTALNRPDDTIRASRSTYVNGPQFLKTCTTATWPDVGSCASWSLMFAHICALHPELEPGKIDDIMSNQSSHDAPDEFLRKYQSFILEIVSGKRKFVWKGRTKATTRRQRQTFISIPFNTRNK